ncbi:MAG TPA: recombination mediator RecR [Acidobacteriaceae bacterium]|nr:recombination mediator RecR [Acidobacteriaceae bacterium]
MSRFAQPLTRLIDELSKLPGIGRKSAQRLSFHILRASEADALALSDAIRELKAQLQLCSICHNITDVDPCQFCANPSRNQALVCVIEEPSNIASIEKTKHYNGVYHVLHGTLSPLNGIGPEHLRIESLLARVRSGALQEIILATNPTTEGEATANYLAQQLQGVSARITRIATGIPAGADIEYADEVTMARAMDGRREM